MDTNKSKAIKEHYFKPGNPGSLGSVKNFLRNSNFKNYDEVKKILEGLHTYSTHRPRKPGTQRRKVVSVFSQEIIAVDLAQMTMLNPRLNKGINYLLIVVEILSKYVNIYPLKNKSGPEVAKAFEEHFKSTPSHAGALVWSDFGTDFKNSNVEAVLKKHNAKLYQTFNMKYKSVYAEAFVKIVKLRIAHYLEHSKDKKYVHILPSIQDALNKEVKEATGLRPIDIRNNKKLESEAWYNQYRSIIEQKRKKPKLKVGQFCRISQDKLLFDKTYNKKFSDEIFKIVKVKAYWPIFTYVLEDLQGNELPSTYYDFELQIVPSIKNDDE